MALKAACPDFLLPVEKKAILQILPIRKYQQATYHNGNRADNISTEWSLALTADSEQLLVAGTDGLHIFEKKKNKKEITTSTLLILNSFLQIPTCYQTSEFKSKGDLDILSFKTGICQGLAVPPHEGL